MIIQWLFWWAWVAFLFGLNVYWLWKLCKYVLVKLRGVQVEATVVKTNTSAYSLWFRTTYTSVFRFEFEDKLYIAGDVFCDFYPELRNGGDYRIYVFPGYPKIVTFPRKKSRIIMEAARTLVSFVLLGITVMLIIGMI